MPPRVAFVLKGYPRLSETFIAQEILELERRGLDIRIVSLRHPYDREHHPVHEQIAAPVDYLPEYLHDEPLRVLRAWWALRRQPRYKAARALWWRDLKRDFSRNRIRRFGQALVMAHELDPDISHLHAHFLHTPSSVTRYCAALTGLAWTCSAHAKDIWTTPAWDIREKLAEVDWLVTCSAVARKHLAALAPLDAPDDLVDLVYHGIDLKRFAGAGGNPSDHDGSTPERTVRLLSVGRAVAKKGYEDLIAALAALPAGLHWRLEHIGGGTLAGELRVLAESAGVAENIDWRGPQPQGEVLQAYRRADLFVLSSRIAGDGDRDGLPNVLMEAQSQALACLATRVSAIPELIKDSVTGTLVPERAPEELAAALADLIADPAKRRRLGAAGRDRVIADFSHKHCIGRLALKFSLPLDAAADGEENQTRQARA